MKDPIGRRGLLKVIGSAAACGPLAVLATHAARADAAPSVDVGTGPRTVPWPYKQLAPDATAERAFVSYQKGHCAYGAFEAIVGQVSERLGGAYRDFPYEMWIFGAGGVNGWGTLCGALNGAAAAFQLLSPQPAPLIDSLFSWYEVTPLPDYKPKGMKFANVQSVAGTPLCHSSVSRWCAAAKKTTYSPERKERCGVVAAAVTRRAVELLNLQAAGKPIPAKLGEKTATCVSCHEKGGQVENTRGKMGCDACHFHLGGEHPKL